MSTKDVLSLALAIFLGMSMTVALFRVVANAERPPACEPTGQR